MEIAFVLVGIAVIVASIILAVHMHEKERSERFQALAAKLEMQFHLKGDPTVQQSVGHLRLFNRGHGRKWKNSLGGRIQDIDVAIFGYRYRTGGGKNQRTHQQSVISFQSPQLSLPDFELRPEGVFHKIGQAFGYKDIDFDSYPIFSKRFLLRAPDEPAIRALFIPEVLEFFESQDRVSVEAGNDCLIYYRARKRIDPENIQSFLEEGIRVYELFKQASSS